MSMQHYQLLLAQLGQHMDLGDCAANKDGYCAFEFDDSLIVQLQYDHDDHSIILHGEVGEVSPAVERPIFRMLLEANLLGLDASRVTFAFNPVTQQVELSRRLAAMLEFGAFEQALSNFVDQLEHWRNQLEQQAELIEREEDDDRWEDADSADNARLSDPTQSPPIIWG
ncbi:MAG: type III secretion system chaperone [Candidatus Competibacteraceae bacterium]|nr:type III secretion system chaperone [Candidatus Competibacteraceae bacterium]MCB1813873.1 type III secretion system chaperone [Candidatus Competibacteraceae bacterium]